MRTWIIVVSMIVLAPAAQAQEAASFLRIGSGARAQSLGGAYTALAADADALVWNPAGLSAMARPEASVTHALYLGDHYDSFNLAIPLGTWEDQRSQKLFGRSGLVTGTAYYPRENERGVLGVGFSRLGGSAQQGRSADRRSTGDFTNSDWAISLGYGRRLVGGLSAGLAVKRVQSRIADASAGAMASDAGLAYAWSRRLRLGAAVRNLGQDLSYSDQSWPLPLTFALGVSGEVINGFTVTGEAQSRPKAGKTAVSLGTEVRLHTMLSLSAGYLHDGDRRVYSAFGNLSAGLGLRWDRLRLDYSLAPYGALGNVQTFSVSGRF